MNQCVVISGCSGGGKSSLLGELARRGHAVVEEPGRRIVRQEIEQGGSALPWIDMAAFARRAIALAKAELAAARSGAGWTFFDRGLVDAAVALAHATGEDALAGLGTSHRYHGLVFLAPPWPDIYGADPERRHGFDAARAEFDRLAAAYPALGYDIVMLPKTDIPARADFMLATLAGDRAAQGG